MNDFEKIIPLISGYKVRREIKKAKGEFEKILKDIEGEEVKVRWIKGSQF